MTVVAYSFDVFEYLILSFDIIDQPCRILFVLRYFLYDLFFKFHWTYIATYEDKICKISCFSTRITFLSELIYSWCLANVTGNHPNGIIVCWVQINHENYDTSFRNKQLVLLPSLCMQLIVNSFHGRKVALVWKKNLSLIVYKLV